jgi:hypothetical protein
MAAMESYLIAVHPKPGKAYTAYHEALLTTLGTLLALLIAFSRPTTIIGTIKALDQSIERTSNLLSRSTRWPLGLLDETRLRIDRDRQEKVGRIEAEKEDLARELRYTQQTVAQELAGWQEWRVQEGKRAIKDLARSSVNHEKARLAGMLRAIRKYKGAG